MLKLTKLSVALLASALIAVPALAADNNKPFLTVNGFAISQQTANAFINEQLARGATDTPEFRNAIKEELTRRALIVSEARKQKLNQRADVKNQVEIATQVILIRAFFQDYLKKHPVTDAELKKLYDEFTARMALPENNEYKVRHILVDNENTAKAIIAKLDKGENFADLAKDSLDPGSKDNGGDLDWNVPSAYVPPFAEALTQLEKGKYTTTPVQTEYGYHVILLEDRRAPTPPTFDELKPQLSQWAEQQKVEGVIDELRAKATIE
jgi:peptidyl-prolyl cis-trans isomerase C